mgnify:FL=1
MKTLLIASSNRGKLVEIRDILNGLPFELVLPEDLGLHVEVAETGQRYCDNAALKAEAYFSASRQVRPEGLLTLADDSGLEVAVLGGAPGLYSARYSPKPGATDADRRRYLIQQLEGRQPDGEFGWRASFHCTVAVLGPGVGLRLFDGECPGEVITEERGTGGFGYDPIFYLPEYGQTMAELGEAFKNRISHRARALQSARPFLAGLAQTE